MGEALFSGHLGRENQEIGPFALLLFSLSALVDLVFRGMGIDSDEDRSVAGRGS